MTKNHTIYSIKSNFCNQYMVWIKPIFDSKGPNFKCTRKLPSVWEKIALKTELG